MSRSTYIINISLLLLCGSSAVKAQVMTTVAGQLCPGSGMGANDLVSLASYNGIAADASGNVYVTEWNSGYVLKTTIDGDCLAVANKAAAQNAGQPSTPAQVMYPHGIAIDKTGNLYVAQYHGCVVRKISPSGQATIVAGSGFCGYTGDGEPATAARIGTPNAIALDNQGNLYITDEQNHVVRKVTADGYIVTLAGMPGGKGYTGDKGPSVAARLNKPYGIATNEEGAVFIADTKNNVVRKVDPAGIITTYAGTGQRGYNGDNGAATSATLNAPKGLAVDGGGNLYVADEENHVIRRISPAGIITTHAGNPVKGGSEEGLAATAARLTNPRDVAADAEGNIYVIDFNTDNTKRIHRIGKPRTDESVKVSMGESTGRHITIENCTYSSVSIINAAGQVVSVQEVTSRTFRINISSLPPGAYTLDFKKDGRSKSVRFTISQE